MTLHACPKPQPTKRTPARAPQWDGWAGSEAALNLLLALHPDRAGEAARALLLACRKGMGAQEITMFLKGLANTPDEGA